MEAGSGMLYPAHAVDGVVAALGGQALRRALQSIPPLSASDGGGSDRCGMQLRCALGRARVTCGRIGSLPVDFIAHTAPPFWPSSSGKSSEASDSEWRTLLAACYANSLDALLLEHCASEAARPPARSPELWVASPLLGAGACGAPPEEALRVAAAALSAYVFGRGALGLRVREGSQVALRVRLVVQEPAVLDAAYSAIAKAVSCYAALTVVTET